MEIKDLDFMQLLPAFMRDDGAVQGMAAGVSETANRLLTSRVRLFSTWNQIGIMSSAELDLLAEELHISWYDKTASLDVKRELIRNSDLVHSKMGTNWAVQNVIETYFGSGKIEEWFDYNGSPYHFRVLTSNSNITNKDAEKFLRVLNKVKRKSALLDGVQVVSDGECNINVFVASAETQTITTEVHLQWRHADLESMSHMQMERYTHEELGG